MVVDGKQYPRTFDGSLGVCVLFLQWPSKRSRFRCLWSHPCACIAVVLVHEEMMNMGQVGTVENTVFKLDRRYDVDAKRDCQQI